MRYKELELFNVCELSENKDGVFLCRYPKSVVNQLGVPEFDASGRMTAIYTGHRKNAVAASGVEIRFHCEGDEVKITLYSEAAFEVYAYLGDFFAGAQRKESGRREIVAKRNAAMRGVKGRSCNRFGTDLWRFLVVSEMPVTLCGVQTDKSYGYPSDAEYPRLRMLAYGSSVTFGSGTPFGSLTYINTAANMLGIDILNKGIAGGCFCEKAVKDYFREENFDCGYFELGTNIANRPYGVLEERVGGFIDGMCESFPQKPLFFMTPVTGLSDVSSVYPEYKRYYSNSRSIIGKHAKKYANAVLLDGHKLLDKDYYLGCDILHPSDFGHVMMGVNLAKMLKKYVRQMKSGDMKAK